MTSCAKCNAGYKLTGFPYPQCSPLEVIDKTADVTSMVFPAAGALASVPAPAAQPLPSALNLTTNVSCGNHNMNGTNGSNITCNMTINASLVLRESDDELAEKLVNVEYTREDIPWSRKMDTTDISMQTLNSIIDPTSSEQADDLATEHDQIQLGPW